MRDSQPSGPAEPQPAVTYQLLGGAGGEYEVASYAFGLTSERVLTSDHEALRLWDLRAGQVVRTVKTGALAHEALAWSRDGRLAISASMHGLVSIWDVGRRWEEIVLPAHFDAVDAVALSPDGRWAAVGGRDGLIRICDVASAEQTAAFECSRHMVAHLEFDPSSEQLASCGDDASVIIWAVGSASHVRDLRGHTDAVWHATWSPDGRSLATCSADRTVRVWDVALGRCVLVLEGHTDDIPAVAWSADGHYLASASTDTSVRIWDVLAGTSIAVLEGHEAPVTAVGWLAGSRRLMSGDRKGGVRIWDIGTLIADGAEALDQRHYTNAKVLLVGDSGAGKTGLSMRLAGNVWEVSDSTAGAWSTQWKLPVEGDDDAEREIWLWDFGGQADQRLIHQLYMDDAAVAVLVFDGQRDRTLESLEQWDRDITRAGGREFSKLLVLGRSDVGGLRTSRDSIEAFCTANGYAGFVETSAKTDTGCADLREAILREIDWDRIPWRSTPGLFKRLREELVRLKDEGRVLLRYEELRLLLRARLHERFGDNELRAVIRLLTGPGVVWELAFGDWILLQPERVNAYAQALMLTLAEDPLQRGSIEERRVLEGDLVDSALDRLEPGDERFVLMTLHQTLIQRGLCVRTGSDQGNLLLFPSFYRRERPERPQHPDVLVSYTFRGFLDEIYATLVVRLHHTESFAHDSLWRYAADFRTLLGKPLGVRVIAQGNGVAELEVHFDQGIPVEERMIFSKYVHEHLREHADDVVRLRHYICSHCGTPVANRNVAMTRLERGMSDIVCVECEQRVPLWDELEDLFASGETRRKVHELQRQSDYVLDNESKERALVGDVVSTVALANHISRELITSDHGIDMEIEFKTDDGEATGKKLYLQLKSGDSYLRTRARDGAEMFQIRDERHARYWRGQAFPVMLVLRSSTGELRWMEIREVLRRSETVLKSFEFVSEAFTPESVRNWRDRVS